jgi:enterochelin esterase-like enzyme
MNQVIEYLQNMNIKIPFFFCLLLFKMNADSQMDHQLPLHNGRILTIDSFPSSYIDARNISVWLPDDYTSSKHYAVLYMHDGQMLFDSTSNWNQQEWKVDETMTRMLKDQSIRDAIVVGIPNNGIYRWAEYVPQRILDSLPAHAKKIVVERWLNDRPSADQYLAFITSELKPFIDQHYSTLRDQANTFIMGSSMGGIISLYAICEYPEVFGGAGCLSTHWPLGLPGVTDTDITYDVPGEFLKYLSRKLPSPNTHKIYFDHGTTTLDSLYKPYQLMVDTIMTQKGYSDKNWVTKEFPGEGHTEQAWARRLHVPLQFLLGEN